jgi:FAD synthase
MRIGLQFPNDALGTSAVAVIGTWDPIVPAHKELFRDLARRGRHEALTPVVIIIYPSPARLLNPDLGACPDYADIASRVALIRECAPVQVLVVRFHKKDLDASCRSFFDLVGACICLRELWLGANQSLGRGRQGSNAEVTALTRRRNIRLFRLSVCSRSDIGGRAIRFLQQGKLRRAVALAGHPPIWRRPQSGLLRVDWPPGRYLALPLSVPSFTARSFAGVITMRLSLVTGRLRGFVWPRKEVEWLAFLAGPADKPLRRLGTKS